MTREKVISSASELDQVGNIQTGTGTVSRGQKVITYANTYTNVYSKKLAPFRGMGNESEQSNQTVYIEKLSWLIQKEDRTIVPNKMRYVVGSKNHNIVNVRAYKSTSDWIVIDTEYRDNQ